MMDKIRKSDAWLYLEGLAGKDGPPKEVDQRIKEKYKGTSIECDPYSYELDCLADEITSSDEYQGYEAFMKSLPENMAEAFYRTGMDHRLMIRK